MRFLLKNKNLIFITGDGKKEATSVVKFVCEQKSSILFIKGTPKGNDFLRILTSDLLIIQDDESVKEERMRDFLHAVKKGVFVITRAQKKNRIKNLLLYFPREWMVVSDYSISRKLKKRGKMMTFGINKKSADFYITDIHQKENETNFKVNYKDNIIPFWTRGKLKKKEVYAMLPALCLARIMGLNLAEVSFKIKERLDTFTKT